MKDTQKIILLVICIDLFLFGAICGGHYVLNHIKIKSVPAGYEVNFEGYTFELESEE